MAFGVQIFDGLQRKTFDSNNSGLVISGRFTIDKSKLTGTFAPPRLSGTLFCIASTASKNAKGYPAVWVNENNAIQWLYDNWPYAQRHTVVVRYGWY